MAIEDIGNSSPSELKLNNHSINFLRETVKWTNFLSIVGFVYTGFIVLIALFGGSAIASMSQLGGGPAIGGTFIIVLYLILAVVYFFLSLYLNKFSNNMKTALRDKNEEVLTTAFENLKSHYKLLGIFTIVMLSLLILFMLLVFMGMAASGF